DELARVSPDERRQPRAWLVPGRRVQGRRQLDAVGSCVAQQLAADRGHERLLRVLEPRELPLVTVLDDEEVRRLRRRLPPDEQVRAVVGEQRDDALVPAGRAAEELRHRRGLVRAAAGLDAAQEGTVALGRGTAAAQEQRLAVAPDHALPARVER